MIKYNKYRIKPKMNDIITIVFENIERGYIPKSKCKFRVSKNHVKELEFNLSDITYGSFFKPTQDRVVKFRDICWVEINYNRYWAEWHEDDDWNCENRYQLNSSENERVKIIWN